MTSKICNFTCLYLTVRPKCSSGLRPSHARIRQPVFMQAGLVERDLYIDGQWRPGSKRSRLDVICPTSEKVVGSIPEGTAADVEDAITAAVTAFQGPWSKSKGSERAKYLRAIAKKVRLHTPCLRLALRGLRLNCLASTALHWRCWRLQWVNMLSQQIDTYAHVCG